LDRRQFIEALILDVVSQGRTVDEARKNLQEALELFFETASPEEIKDRLVSILGIAVGVVKNG